MRLSLLAVAFLSALPAQAEELEPGTVKIETPFWSATQSCAEHQIDLITLNNLLVEYAGLEPDGSGYDAINLYNKLLTPPEPTQENNSAYFTAASLAPLLQDLIDSTKRGLDANCALAGLYVPVDLSRN